MKTPEKCVVTDECTTQEVIVKHHESIHNTLLLLSDCLDKIIDAWVEEDSEELDKAVDEALETVPLSLEEALERLEELAAHASELDTLIVKLKSLYPYDLDVAREIWQR